VLGGSIVPSKSMWLYPDDAFLASLKEVDFDCKFTNESCEVHHFWYKGLHPLSESFHAASHTIRDLTKANQAYVRSRRAFFRFFGKAGLKDHTQRAAACEETLMKFVQIYDSKPELTLPQLDDEVFLLASNAIKARKNSDQLLLESQSGKKI
jgi:hypothetical protein